VAPASKVKSFEAAATPPDEAAEHSSEVESTGEWSDDLERRFNDKFGNISYVDFAVNSEEYQILNSQDFSWGTQGFSLVKRYYSTGAHKVDECFKCIRNLTYKHFNTQKAVDTEPFRMAIWYYVHRLYGIYYDDFPYHTINMFIPQRIKNFVKKAACYPNTIVLEDVANMGVRLLPEEKAHIALLASEARKQAELLYGLLAIHKLLAV